jgi:multiple sugar transport system permease protein
MARPTQFDRRVRRLLLPYAVGLVVLVVLPALLSLALAFFRYDGLSPPRFAGTLNFRLAFTDDLFTLSIANSLALVILPVPLRVFGAFLLAWLAQRGRLSHLLRAAVSAQRHPRLGIRLAWLGYSTRSKPLNRLLGGLG